MFFDGVVSAYSATVCSLANLVGRDNIWKETGGGSDADRFAYLKLLTQIVMRRNSFIRRAAAVSTSAAYEAAYRDSSFTSQLFGVKPQDEDKGPG